LRHARVAVSGLARELHQRGADRRAGHSGKVLADQPGHP
jgi:hypothetical protein